MRGSCSCTPIESLSSPSPKLSITVPAPGGACTRHPRRADSRRRGAGSPQAGRPVGGPPRWRGPAVHQQVGIAQWLRASVPRSYSPLCSACMSRMTAGIIGQASKCIGCKLPGRACTPTAGAVQDRYADGTPHHGGSRSPETGQRQRLCWAGTAARGKRPWRWARTPTWWSSPMVQTAPASPRSAACRCVCQTRAPVAKDHRALHGCVGARQLGSTLCNGVSLSIHPTTRFCGSGHQFLCCATAGGAAVLVAGGAAGHLRRG